MPEMEFKKKAEESPKQQAPETKEKPQGPVFRKIIIRTGENGDGSKCKWPDPNFPEGGSWLLLPRNTPIEVDERAINRQKGKFVTARIRNEQTGEEKEVKQLVYPIDYVD